MSGQRARFTRILRHCRYDGFRSGNGLEAGRDGGGGEGGVNPADECPAENLSRLGLPINDNRLLSRADYAMPPVSRHRVSAIDLFVDDDPFTRPSFPDFAFYNSIFSR